MKLNPKQEELLKLLVHEIETKFADIKFVNALQSPEGENSWWLRFTKPETDERFIEIGEYTSERTTDILLDYGYHFVVLPVVGNGELAAVV